MKNMNYQIKTQTTNQDVRFAIINECILCKILTKKKLGKLISSQDSNCKNQTNAVLTIQKLKTNLKYVRRTKRQELQTRHSIYSQQRWQRKRLPLNKIECEGIFVSIRVVLYVFVISTFNKTLILLLLLFLAGHNIIQKYKVNTIKNVFLKFRLIKRSIKFI